MTTIITKNSSTASSVPVAGDLTKGELAVNVTDKKLYTKDNGGSVVKLVGSLGNQEASAVAITGGTIDGTPIGGTTASTASFTTVSASGNVTLSGGTANGVLYLNGSKVATSGSALTFDGTNFATTGKIGAGGSPGTYTQIWSSGNIMAADGSQIGFLASSSGAPANYMTGSNTSNYLAWIANNAEGMRLTSTGLGIGTSSPGYKLDVRGNSVAGNGTISTALSYDTNGLVGTLSNHSLGIITNSTVVARFDTSGNLGLGVTPSAWSGPKVVQVGNYAAVSSSGAYGGSYSSNAYYDGTNWKYITTDSATRYDQVSGTHSWRTAASGTAGNAITFTQALTLDASGNLLLGATSSLGYRSQIFSGTNGYTQALVQTAGYSSGYLSGTVFSGYYDGSNITDMASIRGGKENTTSGNYGGMLAFYTRSNGGSDTERARIDSSGRFMIGTTSTAAKFVAIGASGNTYIAIDNAASGENYFAANAANIFQTAGSERARIDSSGNLLVGTTSNGGTNAKLEVDYAGSYGVAFVSSDNTSGTQFLTFYNSSFGSCGSITRVAATNVVSYNTTSDYRLKNVIGNVTGSGARIDALEPVEYEWKADGTRTRGFLAHKFQEVYPQSVSGTKDAVDADGNPVYQAMQASTSEVIADLVAEIQSLRKRLADAGIA